MTMRPVLITLASALALSAAACGSPENKDSVAQSAAPAESPSAPAPDAATANWASLDGLVGQYPRDSKLIEDSVITADLKTLMGAKYETLQANMATQSPLERDGSVLYTSGNKAHEGGVNAAYILIDPAQKAMEVGLWEGGKLTTYTSHGANLTKPKDIQTMIANG